MQLIQVGMGRKSRQYTLFQHSVHGHDFLPIVTKSAVFIWRNILVFHFSSYSKYNLLFYSIDQRKSL